MGRNHILPERIEDVIRKAGDKLWEDNQKHIDEIIRDSSDDSDFRDNFIPEKLFLRTVWNDLTEHLENPYPLGRHLCVVPEFGFTKRDIPVEIRTSRYEVETFQLKNGLYTLWHTEARGFVVYPGDVHFSINDVNVTRDGTPVLAFGDADDFADYLVEFDKYIPRVAYSREELITNAMARAKATELLQITVKSIIRDLHCKNLNVESLIISGQDSVIYEFKRYGVPYKGECLITELSGMIYAIANSH